MNLPHTHSSRSVVPCDERGAAALEMALVLPIVLILLLGIVQFGTAYHVQQGLQAASGEGARLASLPESRLAEVAARVREALSGVDLSSESCPPQEVGAYCITVVPSQDQPCNLRRGQPVSVQVEHRSRIDVPLWASPELTLSAKGVYRCEG